MEAVWIAIAYLLGLVAAFLRIPVIVGYLAGGLALYAFGATATDLLHSIGHIGVLLLLFTVGLHLRLRSVIRPEVFGLGSVQLALSAILFAAVGMVLGLDFTAALIVGIILGFSSTVLAAKTLEMRSELETPHGRTAIGILILQDIVAIVILALSGLGAPSLWTLLLLLIPLLRPLLLRLLVASRHDELLLLFGLLLALGGGYLFEALGVSGELGALLFGVLLAGHPKADELAEKLWALKEAFLVGFFLEIGLGGLPPIEGVIIAAVLVLFLPFRTALYFFLGVLFKLRARTGFMIGTSLTSYSEFALIAGVPAASAGLIPESVVLILALTVVLSFAVGAPLNQKVHAIYSHLEPSLTRYERPAEHQDDPPTIPADTRSLVFGMGRTGTAAYNALVEQGRHPVGLDSDDGKVAQRLQEGFQVVFGDAEDPELWKTLQLDKLELAILTLPELEARVRTIEELRKGGFKGVISTISLYPDEEESLREAGADLVAHPLAEAGFGLAEQSLQLRTAR